MLLILLGGCGVTWITLLSVALSGHVMAQVATFTDPYTQKKIEYEPWLTVSNCSPTPPNGHLFCFASAEYGTVLLYLADAPASSNDALRAVEDMLGGMGYQLQPYSTPLDTVLNGKPVAKYDFMTGQDIFTSTLLEGISVVDGNTLYTLAFPSSVVSIGQPLIECLEAHSCNLSYASGVVGYPLESLLS